MPRKARIDTPGALQHIVFRGIERRSIFEDDADRDSFVKRLGDVLLKSNTPCYAWSLMTNHVHLLLRTGTIPLSTLMGRLLTGYAQQFNRRHRRHGQLFQNRYKSFLCEEDPYLLELVRYIHLNPLRAGIVQDLTALDHYGYCGHGGLMGRTEIPWQDTEYVLRQFGITEKAARRNYAEFVANGKDMGKRPDLAGGGLVRSAGGWAEIEKVRAEGARIKGDERILGSSEFVQQVLKAAGEQMDRKALLAFHGLTVEKLLERVADRFNVATSELRSTSKVRRVSYARTVFCHLAVRVLGASCAELAGMLGLSASTVSKAVAKGGELEGLEGLKKKLLG